MTVNLAGAFAVDILGKTPDLPLKEYSFIRLPYGAHDHVDVEIRAGRITLRGSRSLKITLDSANQFSVEVRQFGDDA